MKLSFIVSLGLCFSASVYSTPWESVANPTRNSSSSIGSYANGCLDGALPLPLDGVGYQFYAVKRNATMGTLKR